jgi:hypothetical protein
MENSEQHKNDENIILFVKLLDHLQKILNHLSDEQFESIGNLYNKDNVHIDENGMVCIHKINVIFPEWNYHVIEQKIGRIDRRCIINSKNDIL